MKIAAVILSFIFLALNLTPCNDAPQGESLDCSYLDQSCFEQDEQENAPGDLCSPFCQCHCCHVHSIELQYAELTIYKKEISTSVFLHFDNWGEEITFSHFQPPRI